MCWNHILKNQDALSVFNKEMCLSSFSSLSHSDVYPDGLPSDFSIIATFKVSEETAGRSWDLWEVSDPERREQVGLRFHGDTRSLDFFYTSPHTTKSVRTFSGVERLFDGEWHKFALSVKGDQVRLLIDCQEVQVESVDELRPVVLRGYTSIVKRAVGEHSMSVSSPFGCSGLCWVFG